MRFTRWLLLLCLLPAVASAESDNDSLNQIYHRFSDAYQRLDVDALKQRYHEDAQMLRVSDKHPIVHGREDVLNAYRYWFSKVDKRNATIEIRFRCANRVLQSDIAVDSGYYVMRYSPDPASGESPSQFGGKYLFTFTKNSKGNWEILSDSSNRVSQDMFLESKPIDGLIYNDAFTPVVKTETP